MRWKRPSSVYAALFFLAVLIYAAPAPAIEDAIIAVVNSDVITLKDLRDYAHAVYLQMKTEGKTPAEIDQALADLEANGMDRLIEDKLILDEANRKGLQVRPELVDEELAKIKSSYSTDGDFVNALLSEGQTVTDLRNKLTDRFKVRFIIEEEVKKKIFVNPQEVTEHYRQNFEKYQKAERVDLASIFLSNGDDPAAAERKEEEIAAALKDGKDFASLAKRYSQAADIGIVERGQLLPAIEEAVFRLKPGEVSRPIAVESGIYILKVREKLSAGVSTLEQVKDKIYNLIFQAKFKEKLRTWIDKLKEDAYIEIKSES